MRIAIGSDHAGFELKQVLQKHLEQKGYSVEDHGTHSLESCDYPVYGKLVAEAVAEGKSDLGLLICGTGVGISLAANKVQGVRAVVCSEPYTAMMSRQHNNTNVLALGARVVGVDVAKMIVDTWLNASFLEGRHAQRVAMIENDIVGGVK
ncbi:ribose 5-phosphate isomerase B [Entomospira entomophila]|uniref:Ribose 5-phosphate isomerase B n=1 Tax=Entomospira entomophila TaxID=2719988 RepID=A0A968G839_9SPIO|nr:ribose 5-phosphate isomerase B [Entomospira entomophilus]NIZ40308.1 ribose 5-phosphate isomerase B [Entomospira entomophilus]WDI35867.1 ribose 5-phosphate isomerase B [Entomospira entomophilus]